MTNAATETGTYENRQRLKVTFWDIKTTVVILIFLKPEIAEDVPMMDFVFNAGRFGLTILFATYMLCNRKKIKANLNLILIAGIFTVVFLATTIIGKNYAKALTHYIPSIGLVIYVMQHKKKIKQILLIIANLGIALLGINLITVIAFPQGLLYRASASLKIWFLGQKQDFGGFIFPFIYAALCLRYCDDKYNKKFWIILLLGCVSAILEQPLGVIICLAIFLFLFFFDKYIFMISRNILMITLVVSFFGILYICFNFDNMLWLQNFLAGIGLEGASKLRTVNVRFGMWRFAWDTLHIHPLIGVGNLTADIWYQMTSVGYHSMLDNMYLDILFTGGVVSFLMFIYLIERNFSTLRIVWKRIEGRQIGYCLFALCVLLFEGCPYFPSVFFVFSTPIWFRKLIEAGN